MKRPNIFLDKSTMEKIEFFRQIPLFTDLNNSAMGKVLNILYKKHYPPQEIIFKENELGRAVFIIQSGEVEVIKRGKVLTTLGPGEFFGEMALLEQLPRSATVRTVKESDIYLIYKANLDGLIERNPRVGLKIIRNLLKTLSDRLRKTSERMIE